jgi:ribonuclease D
MTTEQPSLPVDMVVTSHELEAASKDLGRERRIALDLESNGFFRYPERICLVQAATPKRAFLIDPLAIEDMSPVAALLEDSAQEKVLHGADYDIRSVDREWGVRLRGLYDTGVAAHFAGLERLGLGTVLEEVLGTTIPKEKRLQRADWSIRPLSDEALVYAAEDVAHLLELREVLDSRLAALGRREWVQEELSRLSEVRYTPADPETAFLGMKGAGALDGRALAVLKSLWTFREDLARKQGRPPFRVIPEQALLHLAQKPDTELDDVPGLGPSVLRRWSRGLRQAVEEGLSAPPVVRPRPPRERVTADEIARRLQALKELKDWRLEQGKRLGIDPALVWPMVSLERLSRTRDTLELEVHAPEVREWQRREIAPLLQAFWRTKS